MIRLAVFATLIAACQARSPVKVSHSELDLAPCRAMLADTFPDDATATWEILECGDLGVLARDPITGDDFALVGSGQVWHVDHCGWSLIADNAP